VKRDEIRVNEKVGKACERQEGRGRMGQMKGSGRGIREKKWMDGWRE